MSLIKQFWKDFLFFRIFDTLAQVLKKSLNVIIVRLGCFFEVPRFYMISIEDLLTVVVEPTTSDNGTLAKYQRLKLLDQREKTRLILLCVVKCQAYWTKDRMCWF